MKVLVLHTVPPASVGADRRVWEFDLGAAAQNVAGPLDGAIVRGIAGHAHEILTAIAEEKPDVIFNLCEAPLGNPALEAHAAALLEWTGVRFTGCGSETLALCRRKDLTNAVLRGAGVPVPDDFDPADPRFPCIVKPAAEDGSAEIHGHSICHNADELRHAFARLESRPIVQRFMPGREFAVSLWGRETPDYASIGETTFEAGLRLITYEAKWDIESDAFKNSPLSYTSEIEPGLREEILLAAREAWRAVGARHAVRIDIRLDEQGHPRVLDVNPNPEISPEVGICRAVQEAGWQWQDFVRKLVEWA